MKQTIEINTELPVVIQEQIQISGMQDLTRAQAIAVNYAPFLAEIDEHADKLKALKKGVIGDDAKAKRIRIDLGKICSAADNQKKADKQTILLAGRFIDGLFNTINGAGRLTQGEAKEIEDYAEMLVIVKKNKLRLKREKEIAEFDVNPGTGDIADMNNEVWKYYIDGLNNDRNIRIAAEKEAERARIEAQRKLNLFAARNEKLIQFSQFNIQNELSSETTEKEFIDIVEKGETMKKEFKVEQERIRKENEQLKKEAELKRISDEKAEVERQRLAKIEQDKRDKIERERLDKEESERKRQVVLNKAGKARQAILSEIGVKLSFESCKNMDEDMWNKYCDEKNSIYQSEQNRIFTEKLKVKADRKAELAPDKERMTKWIADMEIIDIVNDRMSKDSVLMASEIIIKFNLFKKWATEKVNEIK